MSETGKHVLIEPFCPRCRSARKYERHDSPLFGCWHRWHQELTLDTAFSV